MGQRRITAKRCKVCSDPRRAEIELAHCSGIGLDSIAAKFGHPLGTPEHRNYRMSVWRHCKKHLKEDDRAAYLCDVDIKDLAARAHAESMSLMDYIAIERGLLMRQLQLAAGMNDKHATASLAGKLTELLKLSANVTGELHRLSPTTTTNNIAVFVRSPAFDDLQSMLMRALADHPEALARVVAGLRELEDKAAGPQGPLTIDGSVAIEGQAYAA